ncbi:S49 family peptidase [Phenylobacterium sp. J426]|uniref:S49 family peptidase n=1 Tax=Phenylobacterium sp. J426 TaxID=2898439 RepID=UPI0021516347|nr:S49 family peptidase [Phenylobacterium sp. J426]MCR5874373.1 S49 family peptidase [Phenylobacterium sp. J426]
MRYAHILLAVASEIWAMHPAKLAAMIDFLALQASGVKFTAEEIEARIAPQTAAAVARREGAVAVIPLRGVIANRMSLMGDISGGTSAEGLSKAFQAAVDDDGVKAIVLDVDSPGGNVHGIEELSAQIAAARGSKPIVAQVNATAASAAYWVASAADEVVVTPSGWVGSVGAMTAHEDVSEALAKLGVKRTLVASTEFKGEGAPYLPMTDEYREHLQSQVDAYDAMFVERLAANRGVSSSLVRENYGKGRMVLAREAVSQGMADRVGVMSETLARFGVQSKPTTKARARAPQRELRALNLI